MDAPEPETPFAAVSAQTTKFQRVSHAREDTAWDAVQLCIGMYRRTRGEG